MEKLKKVMTIIMIAIFPLGMIYCVFHSMFKDFASFIGSIFLIGIGVVLGIYLVQPETIINIWFTMINYISVAISQLQNFI